MYTFWEKLKKTPRYGTEVYTSKNVKVETVYFSFPKMSKYTAFTLTRKSIPIPGTPCTPDTTHIQHHRYTGGTVQVYYFTFRESTLTVADCRNRESMPRGILFKKGLFWGSAYSGTIRTGLIVSENLIGNFWECPSGIEHHYHDPATSGSHLLSL